MPLRSPTPPPARNDSVVLWQDYNRHRSEYDQQQDSWHIAQLTYECPFLILDCYSALFLESMLLPSLVARPSIPLVQLPILLAKPSSPSVAARPLSPLEPPQAQPGPSPSYLPVLSSCHDHPSLGMGQVWPISAAQHVPQAQVTLEQFMVVQERYQSSPA